MRRWWYKWRLHVWQRRLVLLLLRWEVQQTHPTGGEYLDCDQGRQTHTTDIENLITRARHQILLYQGSLEPLTIEVINAVMGRIENLPEVRALKAGKESQDGS